MPTLNKLEYLDETKGLIKNALNTKFNSGITDEDTFRSYVGKIQNIYTNWPKVTDKGTELSITAKKGKMVLEPYGNTEQNSYTGNNLLKYPYINTTSTIDNVTFTDNGDGSITINGTSTSSTYSLWFLYENAWNYNKLSFELNPGTYTFKGLTTNKVTMACNSYFSDNSNEYFFIAQNDVTKTFTEKIRLNMRLQINAGVTVNNFTIYPKIEEGSTSTNWEPYVGGIPSPNPDYPQEVKVVTGNNTIHISNSDNTISQEFLLSLGDIELCKIGTYQDYIYKDNGKWYKHSEISKNVINTNNVSIRDTYTNIDFAVIPKSTDDIAYDQYWNNNTFKSNVGTYISSPTWDSSDNIGKISGAGQKPNYWLGFAKGTTLETMKSKLSSASATIYYVLKTPTNTEITDTTLIGQLEALNNAMAFDGVNNISSEYATGNAPVIISASALMKGGN